MNKRTKKVIKFLEKIHFIIKSLPAIIFFIISKFTKLSDYLEKSFDNSQIITWLLILTGIMISSILFFISIYKQNKLLKSEKDIFEYDVWWTPELVPLCPNCEKPLIREDSNNYTLECPDVKCDFQVELKDENRRRISVKEAKTKIKERFLKTRT